MSEAQPLVVKRMQVTFKAFFIDGHDDDHEDDHEDGHDDDFEDDHYHNKYNLLKVQNNSLG